MGASMHDRRANQGEKEYLIKVTVQGMSFIQYMGCPHFVSLSKFWAVYRVGKTIVLLGLSHFFFLFDFISKLIDPIHLFIHILIGGKKKA